MKKTVCALAALVLPLAALTTAPAASAFPDDPSDWTSYWLGDTASPGTVNCERSGRVHNPFSYSGAPRATTSGTADARFNISEAGGARRVVASYTTSGSLKATQKKHWDGSRTETLDFSGKASVVPKLGGICQGGGDSQAEVERWVRVPRAATVSISLSAPVFSYATFGIVTFTPDSGDGTELADEWDFGLRGESFSRSARVRVPAGRYVRIDAKAAVGASNSWYSSQVGNGPVVYTATGENQAGSAKVTYRIVLDPAPGQQKAPSSARTKRVITFPTGLKCSSKYLTVKPKKASKVRSLTVKANGKTLKKFTKVKKSQRVKLKKSRAVKVSVVVRYDSGKVKTVKKSYHGCR